MLYYPNASHIEAKHWPYASSANTPVLDIKLQSNRSYIQYD